MVSTTYDACTYTRLQNDNVYMLTPASLLFLLCTEKVWKTVAASALHKNSRLKALALHWHVNAEDLNEVFAEALFLAVKCNHDLPVSSVWSDVCYAHCNEDASLRKLLAQKLVSWLEAEPRTIPFSEWRVRFLFKDVQCFPFFSKDALSLLYQALLRGGSRAGVDLFKQCVPDHKEPIQSTLSAACESGNVALVRSILGGDKDNMSEKLREKLGQNYAKVLARVAGAGKKAVFRLLLSASTNTKGEVVQAICSSALHGKGVLLNDIRWHATNRKWTDVRAAASAAAVWFRLIQYKQAWYTVSDNERLAGLCMLLEVPSLHSRDLDAVPKAAWVAVMGQPQPPWVWTNEMDTFRACTLCRLYEALCRKECVVGLRVAMRVHPVRNNNTVPLCGFENAFADCLPGTTIKSIFILMDICAEARVGTISIQPAHAERLARLAIDCGLHHAFFIVKDCLTPSSLDALGAYYTKLGNQFAINILEMVDKDVP